MPTTEITAAPSYHIVGYKVEYFLNGQMKTIERDRDGRKLSLTQALWLQKNLRADKSPEVKPVLAK